VTAGANHPIDRAPWPDEMAVPDEITVIARPVRARLEVLLDDAIREWSAIAPDVEAPLDAIRRLVLAGGKRLRPAFCYWGFVGAGGAADDPRVIDAGAAFELLHAFALIHDDVMDGSPTRRGRATVHVEFAARHHELEWKGEPRRFGEGVAILAGDLAYVFANQLVAGLDPSAVDVWHRLAVEVNIGQYLDVLGTVRGDVDVGGARLISRLKSGKYTIERPLHLGAALAGRLTDLAPVLTAYGEPLGEAFQLRDDLLGAFGDSARTGKPVGDDLREGKPTPLLAVARERCTGPDANLLARVGAADLDGDEVAALRELLERCGARQVIERQIAALTDEAVGHLRPGRGGQVLTEPSRDALAVLAGFVGARDR
jgi:geranylgeranyl diphosphate synthase, type I